MDEILKQEMQKELTTRILPYWMERMVDQENGGFYGRITGQELAAQMNLGYETLRKQFKSAVGLSIGQYSIRVRVNRAKSLLLRSGLPLETLAVQLGYPDYFSFCKQFKQHTGVSPAQFRRMN